MATTTVEARKSQLENLINNMDREYTPSDIVDDGSKVSDLPELDSEILNLVQPAVPEGRVLLLNLRFKNEKYYRPVEIANGKKIFVGGDEVQFIDGYLSCDQETADWITGVSPYIFVEPTNPTGDPFTFSADGFTTWNQDAYNQYVSQYYESIN